MAELSHDVTTVLSSPNAAQGTTGIISTIVPSITAAKLIGSANYKNWSTSVRIWFGGQGFLEHLTTKASDVPMERMSDWNRIDNQLLIILWHSIDLTILDIFYSFETCYEVWEQARNLYTNDIQQLYAIVSQMMELQKSSDTKTESYVGRSSSVMKDFMAMLPYATDANDYRKQVECLFMVVTLFGLPKELECLRDNI